jgi:hypothetical protein
MPSRSNYAIFFALLILPTLASSRKASLRNLGEPNEQKRKQLVGFWHIGPNYKRSSLTRDEFVMKQGNEILDSYLFSEGLSEDRYDLKLNYVANVELSNETKSYLKSTGIIHELLPSALEIEDGKEYFEFPTLMELYAFCQVPENIDTTVFYIHSKTNHLKRQRYQDYLLGESCMRCLEEEDKKACGVTYKGIQGWVMWTHFAGNFWMTDCNYISKLNSPWYPEILEEAKIPDSENPWMAVPPYGRYFSEYWMLNDALGPRQPHDRRGRTSSLLKQEEVCSDRYDEIE